MNPSFLGLLGVSSEVEHCRSLPRLIDHRAVVAAQKSVVGLIAAFSITACSSHAVHHSSGKFDPAEQIEMLQELRDKGILTDKEFEAKKTRLLRRYPDASDS